MYRWIFIFILLFLSLNFFEADAQSLNESAQSITKDIIAALPKDSKSIAIIPPRNTEGKEYRGFEIRITEAITNLIKPQLPKGCRLSDRFNIRRIAEDTSLYGQGKSLDELLKEAGVYIHITGSYTVLKNSGRVEINYRAVKENEVLSTAKAVYIPLSELSETSDRILILVRPRGIISAESGRKAVERTSVMTKTILTQNGFNIIESNQKIASEDFLSVAKKNSASILILLDIEGEKKYTDFGNIIGDAKVAVSIYKMPEGEVVSSVSNSMKVGAVNDEDDPVVQAIDIIIEKIAPPIMEALGK